MLDFGFLITNQNQMIYKWIMRCYHHWLTTALCSISNCSGWTGLQISLYLSSPDICTWSLHVKLYMTDQNLSQVCTSEAEGGKQSLRKRLRWNFCCWGTLGCLPGTVDEGVHPQTGLRPRRWNLCSKASPTSPEGSFLSLSAPFAGRCNLWWISCRYLTDFYQVLGGEHEIL